MTTIDWKSAALGALIASGATLGVQASAASGDLIYEAGGARKEITGAQAVCFADCAIAAGSWDGARADMLRVCAQRDAESSTGFSAVTVGVKSAPPGSLPVTAEGVRVVGVAQ